MFIINNVRFPSGNRDRIGTQRDVEKLALTFRERNFEVITAEDLTAQVNIIEVKVGVPRKEGM